MLIQGGVVVVVVAVAAAAVAAVVLEVGVCLLYKEKPRKPTGWGVVGWVAVGVGLGDEVVAWASWRVVFPCPMNVRPTTRWFTPLLVNRRLGFDKVPSITSIKYKSIK